MSLDENKIFITNKTSAGRSRKICQTRVSRGLSRRHVGVFRRLAFELRSIIDAARFVVLKVIAPKGALIT